MLHKDITVAKGNHIIHAWEVADAAARAALVLVAADRGKVALQLDTQKFYILEDDSPATWALLGPTATLLALLDAGGYFTTDNVEAALQEVGKSYRRTCIPIACGDETTAITATAGKVTFRMPFAMANVSVKASLTTAQASGGILTVDVNEAGVSILSTKLTIDNTEKTSATAATPAVVSDADLADDAEITIDVDAIGDGTAKGLKVYIIGRIV